MRVTGDYAADGYALLEGLFSSEVVAAFLHRFKKDVGPRAIPLSGVKEFPNLLRRPAVEVYGHHYPPMISFLWGLTPMISEVVGKDLLPTYNYLRIYREGDTCAVHSDRYSCEHSLSLTLGYSDGLAWGLQVERQRTKPTAEISHEFTGEAGIVMMKPGDGVLYEGVHHRHGRTSPNPNRWSAHLFLHWVDRDGQYRDYAFDGQPPAGVDFQFS